MDSAYHYQQLSLITRDSLVNADKIRQFQNIGFEQKLRDRKFEENKKSVRNRFIIYGLVGILIIFLGVAVILSRNNRQKKKANERLNKTLADLKASQDQLVQREKMASLGELTAGIAHEIQNPLNFVNNFSEVNNELIEEMKSALNKGNVDEAMLIANNIQDNENRIMDHGKRAGSIVKSMLQHSRSGSGKKELADINEIVEEHARLAYHGWRAIDQNFNCKLEISFDPVVGKLNIVSQDIGRVVLNLINNGFYIVNEKTKTAESTGNYEPIVSVSTKKINNWVEIIVQDNGNGIPAGVLDKIFQPFFTTKPTGQGTGLGLSLSYDIVTKGHGGELSVQSNEGGGSEFLIRLPITDN